MADSTTFNNFGILYPEWNRPGPEPRKKIEAGRGERQVVTGRYGENENEDENNLLFIILPSFQKHLGQGLPSKVRGLGFFVDIFPTVAS